MDVFEPKELDSGLNQVEVRTAQTEKNQTDIKVHERITDRSLLQAFSDIAFKDTKITPYQFPNTKAADIINTKIMEGGVYRQN